MKTPFGQPNKSGSSRLSESASPLIRRLSCISLFNWLIEEGHRMKLKSILMTVVAVVLAGSLILAVQTPSVPPAGGSLTADRVIDKAIEQERALQKRMTTLRPLIETYTQQMAPNAELGAVPTGDKYFLGKLDLSSGVHQKSLMQDS